MVNQSAVASAGVRSRSRNGSSSFFGKVFSVGFATVSLIGASAAASAAGSGACLAADALKKLDYQYEQALRTGDETFLAELLADDFVWIHNHAVQFETREALLNRLGDGYKPMKSRESENVTVRRLEHTAVIHGMTTVEQHKEDGLHANRYQFLRTYVATDEGCKLLAGQTMKVWSSEGPVD